MREGTWQRRQIRVGNDATTSMFKFLQHFYFRLIDLQDQKLLEERRKKEKKNKEKEREINQSTNDILIDHFLWSTKFIRSIARKLNCKSTNLLSTKLT